MQSSASCVWGGGSAGLGFLRCSRLPATMLLSRCHPAPLPSLPTLRLPPCRWPAMQSMLQKEGIFASLCDHNKPELAAGPVWCNAAAERYSAIYSAGGCQCPWFAEAAACGAKGATTSVEHPLPAPLITLESLCPCRFTHAAHGEVGGVGWGARCLQGD